MTAPQDPFRTPGEGSTPSEGSTPGGHPQQPGGPTGGYGDPPAGYGAAQPGPPPYGGPPTGGGGFGAPPPPTGTRNGLGVAALILGLLALLTSITIVGGILLGLLAIILGIVGRGRAKRGEANNGGMALAGIILGLLGVLIAGALIAVGASFLNSDTGKKLQDCLESAGGNQAAINRCQTEFQNELTN